MTPKMDSLLTNQTKRQLVRACSPMCALALLILGLAARADGANRMLTRFPTLHGNTVVFEAAGNLWSVSRSGGVARRLTSNRGFDLLPRFSPDGKFIAFTGSYDGNTDVYVIPAEGGAAKRLTFHSDVVPKAPMRWGPDNMVVTWTPDSRSIVFLSRRTTINSWFGRLFQVPVEGGLPQQLPLPKGGMTSYSPDGARIAYNRIFRNFRTWKQYYGGLAQNIWIYDLKTQKIDRVTDWKGTDTDPMWFRDRIYFASDRGPQHRMNLWAYDLNKKNLRQVTHFENFDIDWPSLGDTGVTFQSGGALYVLDLPSEQLHKLDVQVPADGVSTRPRWVDASRQIRRFAIAPNGKRAVLEARGDIFTVPEQHGNTRNLTQTSTANERFPAWSPDGKWIAYTTDINGESQIAIRSESGGNEQLLTQSKQGYYYDPLWSPDSKKLAYSDSSHVLWYLDLEDRKPVKVGEDPQSEIHDFNWSPDSRWLAFSRVESNQLRSVYLYDLGNAQLSRISTEMSSDHNPVFGPQGKFLFFVSERHENPAFSESEFNIATLKMSGIYVTTLQKDTRSPLAPRSDEGSIEKKDDGQTTEAGQKTSGPAPQITIDLEGLATRAVPLPIPGADISNLQVAEGRVYYATTPIAKIDGPLPGEPPEIHVFDMEKRKDSVFASSARAFQVSADGKKIIYRRRSAGGQPELVIASASPGEGGKDSGTPLNLSHMKVHINPVQEWNEMFHEAWRLQRDFFFNTEMNGKDWTAIRHKYEGLLPLLGSREDLNYAIGEMIGELQNSHTYVGGGDVLENEPVRTGLLGVDFGMDSASGRYFLKKVYPGDNSREAFRSPLTEPGVTAKQGDYLLAINGHDLRAPTNPYSLLVNTLGQTVTLTLAENADGSGSHDVTVRPIPNELQLRLQDWIESNRRQVERLSDGKVGYLYLSDMSATGMNQFIRQFYPQVNKQGLIVDVRWNGGGFIDQILLERLRRVLIGMEVNRERASSTIPGQVLHGYMACLTNHYSASDGDIFPYYFKKYHLGPVIGERTWGGVRGIRGEWELLDGGYITIPEFSLYGLNSEWVIENHGVEPDKSVDNLPGDVMKGRDAQLTAAVNYILEELKKKPMELPKPPALQPAYPPGIR